MNIFFKTRVSNPTNQAVMLRWLTKSGMYLAAGQSVLVDGFYPSEVAKTNMLSSCLYDIENGRVSVELVTNLPTVKPSAAELKAVRPQVIARQVQEAVAVNIKTQLPDAKKNERWGAGGIEDMLPPAHVLPGHEETLAQLQAPKTLDIFPNGPTVEPPTTVERTDSSVGAATPVEAVGPNPKARKTARTALV